MLNIYFPSSVKFRESGSCRIATLIFIYILYIPNCHSKIFVEGSRGIHGIKGVDPIVIEGKLMSSAGMVVEYNLRGKIDYKILKNDYK